MRPEIVVYVMLAISPFRVREITNLTTTTLQNITTKFWLKLLDTTVKLNSGRGLKHNSGELISVRPSHQS